MEVEWFGFGCGGVFRCLDELLIQVQDDGAVCGVRNLVICVDGNASYEFGVIMGA